MEENLKTQHNDDANKRVGMPAFFIDFICKSSILIDFCPAFISLPIIKKMINIIFLSP